MGLKIPQNFLVLLHFTFLFSLSSSRPIPSNPTTVCSKTPHPSFCRSSLSKHDKHATFHEYGRFSIGESLVTAKNILSLVNKHVQSSKRYTKYTSYALQDCQFLAQLNIQMLSSVTNVVNDSEVLSRVRADRIQAMLSATLTNLDTCSDGLLEAQTEFSVTHDLHPHLINGTMQHSVSLALFTNSWVPKKSSRGRELYSSEEDHTVKPSGDSRPLKFNQFTRKLYKYGNNLDHGRRLLQLGDIGIIINTTVVVNPDGSGNFTTINDAIAAAPNNTRLDMGYFEIRVVAGVYEEYVVVPSYKKNLLMIGDGINQTIITGNRSVVAGWTTFNSATFAVTGAGFVGINMTIRNTAGPIMHQAVALRNGADLSAFYKCSYEGYQDTLYTHSLRQFYRECDIYGTVDFIFGNGAVVLQNCNIYPRQPLEKQFNAITAQGRTDPNQNTGYSIHNCTIRAADDLASSNYTVKTYLGRPWKQYSVTVYMRSFMDSLVEPIGWRDWNGTFALETLYYAEYNNTGPGSNTTNRVMWPGYHVINATDALNFTVANFIVGDSWLPSTSVPYIGGLLEVYT